MKKIVDILDISFININFVDMVKKITNHIHQGSKKFIVTANPEIVMHTYKNAEYKKIVQSADYVVPDGSGILLASKILNQPIEERITGFDLMMSLLHQANEQNWSIYFLGGKEESNRKAVDQIKKQFPNLTVAGRHHGYFSLDDAEIPVEIEKVKPDIVFVALGFPRQEEWIYHHLNKFEKGIFIGVGGSVDVLAGNVKRAPVIWQKAQLEWLYRLIKQPSRWRRMLALPDFVIKIMKVKYNR